MQEAPYLGQSGIVGGKAMASFEQEREDSKQTDISLEEDNTDTSSAESSIMEKGQYAIYIMNIYSLLYIVTYNVCDVFKPFYFG